MSDAARSAVERFVNRFVIAAKRERMLAMLLHKDRNKRNEALQTVYKWIDLKLQVELTGDSGFPRRLTERFGDLPGIFIDESGASPMTIGDAAGVDGFGALFVADTLPLAVLFPEVGPPTLCTATD